MHSRQGPGSGQERPEPRPFFKKPEDIWTEGIGQAAMSYILFWTLFYDIVHLY